MSDEVKNNNVEQTSQDQVAAKQNQPQFDIVRIYSKDLSLETPNSPAVFHQAWKPELKVEFDAKSSKQPDDRYEVVLRITVTCNIEGKTAFICEVNQAGIFVIKNLPEESVEYLLNASVPNMLFPYAREVIANLVNKATFPQLNLAPINFEAIYRARRAQMAKQQQEQQEPKQ